MQIPVNEHINITEPSEFLIENIDLLPIGKVLDVAMGGGRNAVYLAGRGFDVEGVDISKEAVNSALKLAEKMGVSIRARIVDLEKNRIIEKEKYEVIICFNYLQRSLMPQIKDGLKKEGMVVYETYIIDQAKLGKPKNPEHLLRYNELLDIFGDFRCLRYREGIFKGTGGLKAKASIIAQKI